MIVIRLFPLWRGKVTISFAKLLLLYVIPALILIAFVFPAFQYVHSYVSDDLDSVPMEEETSLEEGRSPADVPTKGKDSQESGKSTVDYSGNDSGKTIVVSSINYKMVYIPPCTFLMGSPSSEKDRDGDETQHKVTLTKGFYLGETEVIQGQWRAVMGHNPARFQDCGDDCPVEQVSWEDCQEFIKRLNQKEGTDKYRLPTEAEWEYACRAGSTSAFANGDITETGCGREPNLHKMGWYCGNADNKTHPVAKKDPNNWGLYDMHGNVWEWCQDWSGDYHSGHVTDPEGLSMRSRRVHRGGSWYLRAGACRSANRHSNSPGFRCRRLGFRLARIL